MIVKKKSGIHKSAVISGEAQIHEEAYIGPHSVITGNVTIGAGTQVLNNVSIGSDFGEVLIGEDNVIFPGAVIGAPPQDLKYNQENTKLTIGSRNVMRECVSIHIGTAQDTGLTSIENDNLIMAYVHIAHDCKLGSHIVVANTSNFAGHITVEDHVKVGGACNFNQFLRLGQHSYIGGVSSVSQDILPFTIARGFPAKPVATNKIGLERAGVNKEDIQDIYKAVRYFLHSNETTEAFLKFLDEELTESTYINHIRHFVVNSKRGIAR